MFFFTKAIGLMSPPLVSAAIYINDLIASLPCNALGYADDLKIFAPASDANDALQLQERIDIITQNGL